jgi:hypothetical protein
MGRSRFAISGGWRTGVSAVPLQAVPLHAASGCILPDVSLAELPTPNREPGFYLSKWHDGWVQAHFIEHLREGLEKDQAAQQAGTTATKMKALKKRDSAFRRLYEEAFEVYLAGDRQVIRRSIREIAYDPEHPQRMVALRFLAEAHLPEMEYKRTKHVTHDNPLQVQQVPFIDPAKLDAMPIEKREQLAEMLREVSATGDPEPRRLRAIDAG